MHASRRTASAMLLSAGLALAGLAYTPAGHAFTFGSGHSASEPRSVADFQAIALEGSMDLTVRQGAQTAVQVQADDNLLPLLETVVEAGSHGATLQVRWKKGANLHTRAKVRVSVVTPKLAALAASGAGDIRIESFTTPALQLSLSGSGDVRLQNLSTDELGVRIAGSGDVGGNGKASRVRISISGSGDVSLQDLQADDVSVRIAGSGDAAVNAQKTLDVSIAGSGDVRYRGTPSLKSSVAGSGSVSHK